MLKIKELYSREEAKRIRESFWTSFGQYMAPITGAEGDKVTWINYKTGIKHLFFRMEADNKVARISIDMVNPDEGMRELLFDQFKEYRLLLKSELNEEWIWDLLQYDDHGKATAKIYTELNGLSIFKKEDWPDLISFFKPRIIALDAFWSTAKYGFEIFK